MQRIQSLIPSLKHKITYVIGFVVFLLLTGAFIFVDQHYRVKHVKIISQQKKGITIRGLTNLENQNLLQLSISESVQTIKQSNSYIKDVFLIKQFPDTVLVKVNYYSPRAYLKMKEGYLLLTDEAFILEKSREEKKLSLPEITYYQNIPFANYQAGQQIVFRDIQDSIYFLQKLSSMKIPINSIDIASFHMLGLYTKEETYIFSSEKDRKQQEYQLDATIRELKISGKKLKSVDVRFDKPVIVLVENN